MRKTPNHKSRMTASLPSLDRSSTAASTTNTTTSAVQHVLQWLPPQLLKEDARLKQAASAVNSVIMASWLSEFDSQSAMKSPALFIEMQLRQAIAATSGGRRPDRFRTACVCECLARLPAAVGNFAGVLQLLRTELLRAVYVNHEEIERRRRRIDAQSLLECKTYFDEVAVLHARISDLEEQLADWHHTKQELAQDVDGRNELLRLALNRWNMVLSTVKSEALREKAEVQDTAKKLSMLLDSMLQHSRAIDELQRLSLLDPMSRLHAQVGALGAGTRHKVLVALMDSYGRSTLGQAADDERIGVLHELLSGMEKNERQALVLRLAAHEGLVGALPPMLAALFSGMRADDAEMHLIEQCRWHASRLPEGAKRRFRLALEQLLHDEAVPAEHAKSTSTQAGPGLRTYADASAQYGAKDVNDHADLLAAVAAEVGPAAVHSLPLALVAMDDEYKKGRGAYDELALRPLVKALEHEIAKLRGARRDKAAAMTRCAPAARPEAAPDSSPGAGHRP